MSDVDGTSDGLLGPENEAAKTAEYLFDDEIMLSNDKELYHDKTSALVKQPENVVSWEITGLYDEDGDINTLWKMKAHPPVLHIKNSNNETVKILLTKNLSKTLMNAMTDVHNGFYGIKTEKQGFKEKIQSIKQWIINHYIISIIISIVIIFGGSSFFIV